MSKRRGLVREGLRSYKEGVQFKIRVPSGKNLFVVIGGNEKIRYLFDFVDSREEDLGF